MRFADLDAVTVDANGTLVGLADPVPALAAALSEQGVERSPEAIRAAFYVEVAHYRPRALRGRDSASLAELRRECVGVFLDSLGAGLDPAVFAPAFVSSLEFRALPGSVEMLRELRARGIALAVVSNWDCSLRDVVTRLGLGSLFSAIVASADVGSEKPDPGIFRAALERLGIAPGRALHIGDEPADAEGARAAGLRFARPPVATAFEGWT